MRFALNIACDNAAFEDDAGPEVALILAKASNAAASGNREGICRDINGNRVGDWRFIEDGED